MDFQPIIFAAGRGSRMLGITSKLHKPLLPIANVPMVWYPLKKLAKAGFEGVIIIVLAGASAAIKKRVDSFNINIKIDWVEVPDDEDWGTAESLRHVKSKIKAQNMLLIGCDVLTTASFQAMADVHIQHNSTLTCLLIPPNESATDMVMPGHKNKRQTETDFIGLDEEGCRMLFYASESDIEEVISVKKSLLRRHPFVDLHADLTDSHLYLVNTAVTFALLQQHVSVKSIKGELIPLLVKSQFSSKRRHPRRAAGNGEDSKEALSTEGTTDAGIDGTTEEEPAADACAVDELSAEALRLSSARGADIAALDLNAIRCNAFVADSGTLCVRVNTIASYMEANRLVPKHLSDFDIANPSPQRSQHIGSDSVAADDVIVGDKSSIKKSIIGRQCTIGEKVKVINSILMDNVHIKEGCNINGCIVGEHSEVQEKCDLKDCIVGCSQTVLALTKCTNEELTDVEKMMEI